MSTPDRLTDAQPRVTLTDNERETALAWLRAHNADKGGGFGGLWAMIRGTLAARLAVQPPATNRDALGMAWDDGNATGLDGWVGPGRGTEPDPEGIDARERYLDRVLAARPAPDTLADRVQALLDHWERDGLVCGCGHELGEHNGYGCYAVLSYTPTLVECTCKEGDDRNDVDFAIRDLRAALLAGRSDASSEGGHDFLPVAGHPDDDECTHRADGTDATYCGRRKDEHDA